MFNLYQIVSGAQGGQALDNLASRFGLSREQADSAVKALMPALSTAFMTKAAQPGGLGDIAGAMADPQHRQAYADPAAAQEASAQQKGADVAGSLFGSTDIVGHVARQAAAFTGLPEATVAAMLPTVVSMVVGGAATALHNQGLGAMLGTLAQGGLANMLGQFGGGGGATAATAGGFPAMVGSLFSNLLGGAPATPAGGAPAMPPMMQAGMDALLKMFQPGVAGHGGQASDLGDKINASFNERR